MTFLALLLLATPPADSPFIAHEKCILKRARKWEPSREPANIIAKAAVSHCTATKYAVVKFIEAGPTAPYEEPEAFKKGVMAALRLLEEMAEANAIALILDLRSKR
ncbi:hypothetical protein [Sphingorhabdus sp. EL138]|uniref:hypothetical protein n=1 Tax=Sphingorhabdus sp. EL138 TaxID=2073156 RepID=UPI0025E05084|nr:hypothetical protein [Sphingorhabdus sp. EL138]